MTSLHNSFAEKSLVDCRLVLLTFDMNSTDLQKLRAQVVTEIRSNQQLENDLNLMDIKIGLLVRNRITLQVFRFLQYLCNLSQ